MNKNVINTRLPSGFNVALSENIYDGCYCEFDELKYYCFNNIINSGQYFPQIFQFIFVLSAIFIGYTSFLEVVLCNLIFGIGLTIIWYTCKLYNKIPGINFLSCIIGGNIFRFFLHFLVIIIISIFVLKKWELIIFCLVGGLITQIIKSILMVKFSNVKYNDGVAKYVSKFKNTK